MKNISIKIYRSNGEFIKEWDNVVFDGFSKEINSGLGECIITLGEKFDYSGSELNIGNIVDILVSDNQTLEIGFLKIYSGYISMIEPKVDGAKEEILVHILGHYTKLSTDILKDGTQVVLYSDTTNGLTTTSSGTESDIGLILRAIINRYREETSNPMIYSTINSIPIIGQEALYSISMKTYRDAFDSVCSMLPSGYFWYVDETNLMSIKSKPSTATHSFELGKHIKSIKIEKSIEKIRNFLLIWNGETGASSVFNHYQDDASILKYGRRAETIVDYGIDDDTSADKIGAKFIAENKDPSVRLVCEIIDNNYDSVNGYDIESIQPGDTCSFYNFNASLSDVLQENMLITKVNYLFDRVIIEVELVKTGLVDWQEKTALKVEDLASYSVPEIYT
jgi:hypothetical protein